MTVPRYGLDPDDQWTLGEFFGLDTNGWKRGVYRFAHACGFTKIVRGKFAGSGSLLMFHEVQEDVPVGLTGGISPRFLEELLTWLKAQGWTFVSLSSVLRWRDRPLDRFVCLTFDDGYRDFLTNALPILERHGAPFILYVPTAAITRDLCAWWLGLRELLLRKNVIDIDVMGVRFACPDLGKKIKAFRAITSWVRQDYRRQFALQSIFVAAGLSYQELNERYYINKSELQTLSRHPLATIGGHTSSHTALSTLERAEARSEIAENRRFLENLVQKPVVDLAYPYGDERSCGPREGRLAADEGFRSAVTTRTGSIWPEHENSPYALPRIGINMHEPRAVIDGRISGIQGLVSPRRRFATW